VFFVEEPVYEHSPPRLEVTRRDVGLWVVVPHLAHGTDQALAVTQQREMLAGLIAEYSIDPFIAWYYTPMAIELTTGLVPDVVVYDCMDELSAFRGAPPELCARERVLFERADLVFTGGESLYEAKRHLHKNVHAFPSSVDVAHFGRARFAGVEPADQAPIPSPRLGFAGVIDERMDTALLAALADAHPEWQIVMVGPVVKIDPASLPRRANLHYLGARAYDQLPSYIAGWNVALLPFALNESTRFISPTKTPEYLAAGKRVVATPIRDVVRPYGDQGLVEIGEDHASFIAHVERMLAEQSGAAYEAWLSRVDAFLSRSSWDSTWQSMSRLIDGACGSRGATAERACLTA